MRERVRGCSYRTRVLSGSRKKRPMSSLGHSLGFRKSGEDLCHMNFEECSARDLKRHLVAPRRMSVQARLFSYSCSDRLKTA
jgi:hypothetical protein